MPFGLVLFKFIDHYLVIAFEERHCHPFRTLSALTRCGLDPMALQVAGEIFAHDWLYLASLPATPMIIHSGKIEYGWRKIRHEDKFITQLSSLGNARA